jgi:hypothetical protein
MFSNNWVTQVCQSFKNVIHGSQQWALSCVMESHFSENFSGPLPGPLCHIFVQCNSPKKVSLSHFSQPPLPLNCGRRLWTAPKFWIEGGFITPHQVKNDCTAKRSYTLGSRYPSNGLRGREESRYPSKA